MTKKTFLCVVLAMALTLTSAFGAAQSYTGTAKGFGGDVTAEVTVEGGRITALTITADAETPSIGGVIVEPMTATILEAGNAQIDAMAGATITSNAIKAAVNAALTEAGVLAAESGEISYTAGTYTGTAGGRGGDIVATVTVTDSAIEKIEIVGEFETVGIADMPMEQIPADIIKHQSLGIDSITGATLTSVGVVNAVANALEQAGANVDALRAVPVEKEIAPVVDMDTQIVVAGAGIAGMVAAVTAAEAGADVVLVEKLPYLGGTLLVAAGGGVVAESQYMIDQGMESTIEHAMEFVHMVNEDSIRQPDYGFIENVLRKTGPAIDFLVEIGMTPRPSAPDLRPGRVRFGGNGAGYAKELEAKLNEFGVTVLKNTSADEIIMEDGKAVGLKVIAEGGEFTIRADKVIMATGGASRDWDRMIAANPGLVNTGIDEQASMGNTADGFRMLEEIGAKMGEGPFVKSSLISFSPAFRFTWANVPQIYNNMVFDANGIRFTAEDLSLDEKGVTTAVNTQMIRHGSTAYYALYDTHNISETLLPLFEEFAAQENPEIVVYGANIQEIAEKTGVNAEILTATYNRYQEACAKGLDVDHGKAAEHLIGYNEDGGLYAARILPGSFGTLGGALTDYDFHVQTQDGGIFENLFAVGEVATSTLYGDYYMGGFSLGYYAGAGHAAAMTAVAEINAVK